MFADQALARFIKAVPHGGRVLEIGPGSGEHTLEMVTRGLDVVTVGPQAASFAPQHYSAMWPDAMWDIGGDEYFSGVFASHVLEHSRNVGLFLDRCRMTLEPGGVLCVTVPPAKTNLVGGHLTLWTPALLVYNLILAGFDCRNARVRCYGYNITAMVSERIAELPPLVYDNGDIETLAPFFPWPVYQGINGNMLPMCP